MLLYRNIDALCATKKHKYSPTETLNPQPRPRRLGNSAAASCKEIPGCAAPSSNPRETKTAIVTGRIERVLDLDADNVIIEAWRRNLLRPRQAFERSGLHYLRT